MNGTSGAEQLEAQARRLQALAVRLEEERQRLPRRTDVVWRGPAAIMYLIALEGLVAQFAAAHQQLVTAATASRRAAATITAAAHG
jgi:hypothetical protein